MEPNKSLTQFYDDLKADSGAIGPENPTTPMPMGGPHPHHPMPFTNVHCGPGGLDKSPGALAWRSKAAHNCAKLKDDCCKHILVDIYCKINPMDKDYIDGHHRQMQNDVDCMLNQKGMSASQYLTSCQESTHAPLLEFILRSSDEIAKTYMEEAEKELKDAQENDVNIPDPKTPSTDDAEISNQLIDVKQDREYENFIDKLKEKTVNKIVSDVSKLISDKKEERKMTFNTTKQDEEVAQESAIGVGISYLQKNLWKENIELTDEQQEEMIGMAIREATLHQLDVVFNQPERVFKEFASRVRFGKGFVVNESAVNYFKESVK